MKHFYLSLVLVGLCGCAGNPPDWWNPSGAYGSADSVRSNKPAAVSSDTKARATEVEIPAEERIEASVEEYEEINLNPLEQTETVAEESSEQADPMYAPAEEHTADTGALPPPSVLQ